MMILRAIQINVSLTRKHIYEVIEHLQAKGEPFSIREIANTAGCHWETAYKAIQDLAAAGELRIIPGRGQTPATYELNGANHDQV